MRTSGQQWCTASGAIVTGPRPDNVSQMATHFMHLTAQLKSADRSGWDVVDNVSALASGHAQRWSSLGGSFLPLPTDGRPNRTANNADDSSDTVAEERLASASDEDGRALRALLRNVTQRWAGIIFVGDSQAREVAWGMHWLLRRAHGWATPVFHDDTKAQMRHSALLSSGCTPEFLGRLGFVVVCASAKALAGRAPCTVHKTDTDGVSIADSFKPLIGQHEWDRNLTVLRPGQARSALACGERAFFLAYQPVWGATPLSPSSLPPCMHLGGGRWGLRKSDGSIRPILCVVVRAHMDMRPARSPLLRYCASV